MTELSSELLQLIQEFPDKEWNWFELSVNIPFYIVKQFLHKKWDYHSLSKNPNITFQNILDYKHLPWDWKIVSERKDVISKDIEENPDLSPETRIHRALLGGIGLV